MKHWYQLFHNMNKAKLCFYSTSNGFVNPPYLFFYNLLVHTNGIQYRNSKTKSCISWTFIFCFISHILIIREKWDTSSEISTTSLLLLHYLCTWHMQLTDNFLTGQDSAFSRFTCWISTEFFPNTLKHATACAEILKFLFWTAVTLGTDSSANNSPSKPERTSRVRKSILSLFEICNFEVDFPCYFSVKTAI